MVFLYTTYGFSRQSEKVDELLLKFENQSGIKSVLKFKKSCLPKSLTCLLFLLIIRSRFKKLKWRWLSEISFNLFKQDIYPLIDIGNLSLKNIKSSIYPKTLKLLLEFKIKLINKRKEKD